MSEHQQAYSGDHGAATDVGAIREVNEDTYSVIPEAGLWLVADGMGGHQSGDIASAITRDTIAKEISAGDGLPEAIKTAHANILAEMKERKNASGMGSTVVGVLLDGNDYEVAWVGDSRAYLWDGRLMQITKDHSYVRELIDSGAISEEEAENHPSRHLLTRCLGAGDTGHPVEVDRRRGRFSPGQALLLCSDGLTTEVSEDEIERILSEEISAQERVDKLVKVAVEHGGRDNVTVVLLSAPEAQAGLAGWVKNAVLLLAGASLAVVLLGLVFYLRQRGML